MLFPSAPPLNFVTQSPKALRTHPNSFFLFHGQDPLLDLSIVEMVPFHKRGTASPYLIFGFVIPICLLGVGILGFVIPVSLLDAGILSWG